MASSRVSIAKPPAKTKAAPVVAKSSLAMQTRPFAARHDEGPEQESEDALMARAIQTRLMDMPVQPLSSEVQRSQEATKEDEDLTIQPKLTIGQPGDRYEQEADQMAAKVMRMPAGDVAEEEETVQMKSAIQRQAVPEEEEETLQARPQIQAKGTAPEMPDGFQGS